MLKNIAQTFQNSNQIVLNLAQLCKQALEIFDTLAENGRVQEVLSEVIRWSKVEFNIEEPMETIDSVVDEDEDTALED